MSLKRLSRSSGPDLVSPLVLLGVLSFISGCAFTNPPRVTDEGEIKGGHPKIRALLETMKREASKVAEGEEDVASIRYAASIAPDMNSETISGSIPPGEARPRIKYVVVASRMTIGSAEYAVITAVRESEDGTILDWDNQQLRWKDNRWHVADLRPAIEIKEMPDAELDG